MIILSTYIKHTTHTTQCHSIQYVKTVHASFYMKPFCLQKKKDLVYRNIKAHILKDTTKLNSSVSIVELESLFFHQ